MINEMKLIIPAALIILSSFLTFSLYDLNGRNTLIDKINPGIIRNSRNMGPANMKLIIKRIKTKTSHETGPHEPHISTPVLAE
jgi:hypothetical protein